MQTYYLASEGHAKLEENLQIFVLQQNVDAF
jgi:hypothetical protein